MLSTQSPDTSGKPEKSGRCVYRHARYPLRDRLRYYTSALMKSKRPVSVKNERTQAPLTEFILAFGITIEPEIDVAGRCQDPRVQLSGRYLCDVLARFTSAVLVVIFVAYLKVVALFASDHAGPNKERRIAGGRRTSARRIARQCKTNGAAQKREGSVRMGSKGRDCAEGVSFIIPLLSACRSSTRRRRAPRVLI
ncbi:hypothetical protein BV22DRAFT_618638 [Leucogyrophana mollusca]|uniref:Uncharacterized protein n=1 Tax=Leucogyrophana mollusca TaxID=85980 RepID=A0ACB8BCN0_9AGAM|nr:hypothetical protein BV22DRAFT_618638 [Leucogyrophana mollusca]